MCKLTVCGGGNATHVMIALGTKAGWDVDVYAPYSDEAERLTAGMATVNGIFAHMSDGSIISGMPRMVSADPKEVIPGSSLILLTLPAFAHGRMLQEIASYLDEDVMIGAIPARGGFDYQAKQILNDEKRKYTLFGLQTLPWACRINTYGQSVDILGVKTAVNFSVYPENASSKVIDILTLIPEVSFSKIDSFLTLTLANTGQIIHPGIMYGLFSGREDQLYPLNDFPLFYQNVDEKTVSNLAGIDGEIQKLSDLLAKRISTFNPQQVQTLHQWLLRSYPTSIEDPCTLKSSFTTNRAYQGLRAPAMKVIDNQARVDFNARYLSEDVPYGLVVVRGIAELAEMEVPFIDRNIIWAQNQLGRNYLVNGHLTGLDIKGTRAPQVFGIQSLEQLARLG